MKRYTYYQFFEKAIIDGQEQLLTIHGDPMVDEFALDFCWDTEAEAIAWLKIFAEEGGLFETEEVENWVLCKITKEIVNTNLRKLLQ